MNAELTKLAALAAQLPRGLRSDWEHTNHYELTCDDPSANYWWWQLDDVPDMTHGDVQASIAGRRLGLLMNIAEEVSRLRDLGLLPKVPVSNSRANNTL